MAEAHTTVFNLRNLARKTGYSCHVYSYILSVAVTLNGGITCVICIHNQVPPNIRKYRVSCQVVLNSSAGRKAPPTSTRISARLKRVWDHSSPLVVVWK